MAVLDNFVVNAFLLALVVDAHVAENTEAELGNLRVMVIKDLEYLALFMVIQHLGKAGDSMLAKQSLNAAIAKGEIDEGF